MAEDILLRVTQPVLGVSFNSPDDEELDMAINGEYKIIKSDQWGL